MQLGAAQGDGATLRVHLQRLAASTGKVDPLLDVPAVPTCAAALWHLWCSLNQTRPSGMGPSPISHQEIAAACHLHGVQLSTWEVDTLIQLDGVALRHAGEQMSKQQRNKATQ